jgi:amidase
MVDCIESGVGWWLFVFVVVFGLGVGWGFVVVVALQGIDALLTLSVSGEAPEGLSHTGDSTFQSLWTLLHVPSLTLPTSTGETNLPIGIQLIAPRFHDDQLLRVAEWVWTHLR